jgi:kojibiose phosphorylase
VDNNVFTNVLAQWNLRTALKILEWLKTEYPHQSSALETDLEISSDQLNRWHQIIEHIDTGYNEQRGIYEQFNGFFALKDIDLASLEPRSKSMQALLGIEGVQDYQVIKQPDVLMLLFLLGDEYDQDVIKTNWDYYTPRTDLTYGSSLGPAIQAALAARLGDPALDILFTPV